MDLVELIIRLLTKKWYYKNAISSVNIDHYDQKNDLIMTSSDKKTVTAEELLELRQKAGHTQQEAADFLYVTKRTYQNWEYNKSRMPFAFYELYELKAIARGLIKTGRSGT